MAAIDEEAAGEDKLINDCRTSLDEIKTALNEAEDERRADLPEPEDGWPEFVVKDSEIRVPNKLLWEVLKIKLGKNDCRNRGYILDGFPREYKDAQNCFLKKVLQYDENGDLIEDEDDVEDGEDGAEPSFDKHEKN